MTATEAVAFATEREVAVALAERFGPPEYAFFQHVRNGTGYSRKVTRTADAMAMSLWPSRGLHLHGFEIKVTRSDWLREVKDPAKADELVAYCDRWWVVVGNAGIVQDGELPPTWGLIVPNKGKLRVKVEAPQLEPKPFDRLFFASLMRCAHEVKPDRQELQQEYQRGVKAATEQAGRDYERVKADLSDLRKKVQDFGQASGVDLLYGWDGQRIGEAVRVVMQGKHLQGVSQLRHTRDALLRTAETIDRELKAIDPEGARSSAGGQAPA